MTRVSDMAKVTASGYPVDEADSIEQRAYLVWQRAVSDSRRIEPAPDTGLLYRGNLKTLVIHLWPQLSANERKDELAAFISEVYAFLKATGNAHCVNRSSDPSKVVWWLASVWGKPAGTVVLKIGRGYAPTAREKKLTPHEAGEDRVPAPVTITKVAASAPAVEETKDTEDMPLTVDERVAALRPYHEKAQADHRQMLELIVLELGQLTQPVTSQEIAKLVGVSESTASGAVNELVKEGRLYSRVETPDERGVRYGGHARARRSALFSTYEDVPARTVRTVVKGFTAEFADRHGASPKFLNDAKVAAALTQTFMRPVEISIKSGVPAGSMNGTLSRLVEKGVAESRKRMHGKRQVTVYRKKRGAPMIVPPPEAPALVETPKLKAPSKSEKKSSATFPDQLVQLIEQHYGKHDDSALADITRERDELRAKVNELEATLASIRKMIPGI